jgi:hypothetical protein
MGLLGTVAADPAQYEPQFSAEQFHAPLRLNNATRLSGMEWLWYAKRA